MMKTVIKLNLKRVLFLSAVCIGLTACGGGSNSGGGEPIGQAREANECVSFASGLFLNSCDFAIVAVTFGGRLMPVTVPANGSAIDPNVTIFSGTFAACITPFTPVGRSATEFECL